MYMQIISAYESVICSWKPRISHRAPIFLSYIGSRLYNTQLSVKDSDVDLALVYLEDSIEFFGMEVATLASSKEELFAKVECGEQDKEGLTSENSSSHQHLPNCHTMDIKIQELQKILEWIHYGNPSASEYLFSCDSVLCIRSATWDKLVSKCERDLLTQKLCDRFLGFARSQVGIAQGRWQRIQSEMGEDQEGKGGDPGEQQMQSLSGLTWKQRRKLKRAEKCGEAVVFIPQHTTRPVEKGRTDWQKPLCHAIRNLFLAQDVCYAQKPAIRVTNPDHHATLLRVRRCELSYEETIKLYETIRLQIQTEKKGDSFLDLEEDFDNRWLSMWLREVRLRALKAWDSMDTGAD